MKSNVLFVKCQRMGSEETWRETVVFFQPHAFWKQENDCGDMLGSQAKSSTPPRTYKLTAFLDVIKGGLDLAWLPGTFRRGNTEKNEVPAGSNPKDDSRG